MLDRALVRSRNIDGGALINNDIRDNNSGPTAYRVAITIM